MINEQVKTGLIHGQYDKWPAEAIREPSAGRHNR